MKNFNKFSFIKVVLIILCTTSMILLPSCSDESTTTEPEVKKPVVVNSPAETYFGQIPQGQHATQEFIIFNTGSAELVISEMAIAGTDASAFSLSDGGAITIPPNKIESFVVNFNPDRTGDFEAQVTITSNADTSPDEQPLTGKATGIGANITFERIIGGRQPDSDGNIRLLSDGGYIVAGNSQDVVEEENVATLTRLDQYGNVLWSQQYPVNGLSNISSIVVTANDNFIFTGTTRTQSQSNSDVFTISTDGNGSVLWEKVYDLGGSLDDAANHIIQTSHGSAGYLIAGTSRNTNEATGGVRDALLLKIDNSGEKQWHKLYGTTEGEEAISVVQTKTGDFVFAGSTTIPSTEPGGDFDYYLVKTDADGNQKWFKTFGGANYDFASSIIEDNLGGYVIAGYTSSIGAGARDYWVIKTDTSGIEQWNQTYGGPENDSPSEIIQTTDDGFFIVGGSSSFTTNNQGEPTGQVWVIKTGNSGSVEWDKLYGGERGDGGSSAREITTGAGGYIISGTTSSFSDNNDVYVLKTNSDGSI